MNSKLRRAFTLVELSVVIVILSILIATVIVSRNLIESAKINKIQEDYRSLRNAVNMFHDAYSCLPGDCTAKQIGDFIDGLPAACTATVRTPGASTMVLNSGWIDSVAKRTCMVYSLHLAGYMGSDITIKTDQSVVNSISGFTMPYAKFDKRASWDFRLATGNTANEATGMYTMPIEAGLGSLSSWKDKHILILRASNSTAVEAGTAGSPASTDAQGNPIAAVDAIPGTSYDIAVSSLTEDTGAKYGITAVMASKLDTKFDDGLPLSGGIMAGRLAANFADSTASACHDSVGGASGVSANANYLKVSDMNKSCIVAYRVHMGS